MNGSNHLEESDNKPSYLCPIDLLKQTLILNYDIEDRYLKLLNYYENNPGFKEDEEWLRKYLTLKKINVSVKTNDI